MSGFNNPVVGALKLIREAIQSPNYQPGADGWSINQDGSAEFNNITARGEIDAGSISAGTIGSSQIVDSDFQGGTMENTVITFDSNGGTLLVYASTSVTQTFVSSGTFTVPAGITRLVVECWGAGGGGAGGGKSGGSNSGGYGAGGGAYAKLNALTVTPGQSFPVTVGTGGSGGAPNSLGSSGGASKFDSVCVANGGSAATLSSTGKGGSASSSVGDVKFGGGGAGIATGSGGCGGGSSAGTASNGNLAADNTGSGSKAGGAAVPGGGAGGAGAAGNTNGAGGGAPGGGGGGGGGGASAGTGGAGARGQVRVTYTSAQTLIASMAPKAGTDSFGHAYPAGFAGPVTAFDPVNGGPETWHAVTYGSGWSDAAAPVQGTSYRLTPFNTVELKGAAGNLSAAAGQTMFTLPAAYRPPFVRSLPCLCRTTGTTGQVTFNPGGTVVLDALPSGGHTFEFDGCSFSLDA